MREGSTVVPEIGKLSTALWVWACHFASSGTRTSPMESCSILYPPRLLAMIGTYFNDSNESHVRAEA